ncbi:hypothetical protein GIS00_01450 [Nakamurella sp. YIM 132087]|uniref:Zinc finger CGNR domain-containing protein n=1 Tax=Nakamurella alba TaxID=2665158 RepID=A0A7K1FGJ8_9ACTN|nr:CGNR zinc finger domain-containing protein [Nakamurella alba]MTD12609.1 hypothetical protein [Nakamurella alba]
MTTPRMAPSLAKRFRSGRVSLDFAHTAATDEWIEPELIGDAAGLERWLGHVLRPMRITTATPAGTRDNDDPTTSADLTTIADLTTSARPTDEVTAAHELRGAILRLARILSRDNDVDDLPGVDVETVNRYAASPPPAPRMAVDGTAAATTATVPQALSVLARDAVDLFTGPLAHRIRECEADGCAFLFVDASRPGTRRWCSMERCGNLLKVRKHRSTTTP